MKILVLGMGGTIDDLEYDNEKDAPKGRASVIPKLLHALALSDVETHFEPLILKDSEFITDADRETLLARINESDQTKIVVTHGTKTMAQTAKHLGNHLNNKTVVLTGSMTLPSVDQGKDATTALSFAIKQVQLLPFGVFVAMQGKIFDWDNVKKNVEQGKFEKEK